MRLLLDEMMSEHVSKALDAFGSASGDSCVHILDLVDRGLPDEDIPRLCGTHAVDALITMNVKDFGAKKHYYGALVEAGIHVVVVRAKQPDAGRQLALVSAHYERIARLIQGAREPILIRVTQSSAVVRDLDELVAEISGGLP